MHALTWKGGAVPDRLYPGDEPPSHREFLCPGPSAQLRPMHCAGLTAKRFPDKAQEVPRGTKEFSSEAGKGAYEGGRCIRRPTVGSLKIEAKRGETEHVDLIGDVETRQRESLRVPGPGERAGINEHRKMRTRLRARTGQQKRRQEAQRIQRHKRRQTNGRGSWTSSRQRSGREIPQRRRRGKR